MFRMILAKLHHPRPIDTRPGAVLDLRPGESVTWVPPTTPGMTTTPWDFWNALDRVFTGAGGFGVDQGRYSVFKKALQRNKRFTVPWCAQEVFEMAALLKAAGEDAEAKNLIWSVLSHGFDETTQHTRFVSPDKWEPIPRTSHSETTWRCRYCGSRHALALWHCANCGAPRPEGKPMGMKERVDA